MSTSMEVDLKKSSTVELLQAKASIGLELASRTRQYLEGAGWRDFKGSAWVHLNGGDYDGDESIGLRVFGAVVFVKPEEFDRLAQVETSL